MEQHIVNLTQGDWSLVRTKKGVELVGLHGKTCRVQIERTGKWLYFKFTVQKPYGFGGFRLQQDEYDDNKFYVTDELNKWHGIIGNGLLSKGRQVFVYTYI